METKTYGSITITDVTDGQDGRGILGQPIDLYYLSTDKIDAPHILGNDGELFKVYDDEGNQIGGWTDSLEWNDVWTEVPYIWTTTETTWTTGEKTYEPDPPKLLSEIETATIFAKKADISLGEWCGLKKVTIIDGSTIVTESIDADRIKANSITADQLATDAIKSNEYDSGAGNDEDGNMILTPDGHYSKVGTFLNLANGSIHTPNFAVDGETGDAYFNGTLGADTLNAIEITTDIIKTDDYVSKNAEAWGGYTQATPDLEYSVLKDGDGNDYAYKVTGFGSNNSGTIVIPSMYNNLPVTEIAGNAFNAYKTVGNSYELVHSIECIIIPDSVTTIGKSAFNWCTNIKEMVIPNSVTQIGTSVFNSCLSMQKVDLPDALLIPTIPSHLFNQCYNLKKAYIPKGVVTIGNYAFNNCRNALSSVEIPDGVTTIGNYAFNNCNELQSVIIPNSLISIGSSAFSGCEKLTTIYYKGTKSEWSQISSHFPSSATVYYYSESAPALLETTEDKFWHYNEDGFKISNSDDYMIDSKNFKVTQDGKITVAEGNIGNCILSNGELKVDKLSSLSSDMGTIYAGALEGGNYSTKNVTKNIYVDSVNVDFSIRLFPIEDEFESVLSTKNITISQGTILEAITNISDKFDNVDSFYSAPLTWGWGEGVDTSNTNASIFYNNKKLSNVIITLGQNGGAELSEDGNIKITPSVQESISFTPSNVGITSAYVQKGLFFIKISSAYMVDINYKEIVGKVGNENGARIELGNSPYLSFPNFAVKDNNIYMCRGNISLYSQTKDSIHFGDAYDGLIMTNPVFPGQDGSKELHLTTSGINMREWKTINAETKLIDKKIIDFDNPPITKDALNALPKIIYGSQTIEGINKYNPKNIEISFSTALEETPKVFVQITNSSPTSFTVYPSGIDASGFTLNAYASTSDAVILNVDWLAISDR